MLSAEFIVFLVGVAIFIGFLLFLMSKLRTLSGVAQNLVGALSDHLAGPEIHRADSPDGKTVTTFHFNKDSQCLSVQLQPKDKQSDEHLGDSFSLSAEEAMFIKNNR
jgi:hypothetical protein